MNFEDIQCFYIFQNGIEIKYPEEQKPLDKNGKIEINKIIESIKNLNEKCLEYPQDKKNIISILYKIEHFPYLEIIPIILEILKTEFPYFNNSQIYICLKIFEKILMKNKLLHPHLSKIFNISVNVLLSVYFNTFIFQEFVLYLIKEILQKSNNSKIRRISKIRKDEKDKYSLKKILIEHIKKLTSIENNKILFYYNLIKIFKFLKLQNHEEEGEGETEELLTYYEYMQYYNKLKKKILNIIPFSSIEKEIQKEIQ